MCVPRIHTAIFHHGELPLVASDVAINGAWDPHVQSKKLITESASANVQNGWYPAHVNDFNKRQFHAKQADLMDVRKVHAANGYLALNQLLDTKSNKREDGSTWQV